MGIPAGCAVAPVGDLNQVAANIEKAQRNRSRFSSEQLY
jgi:hypothetical protein